MMLLAISFGEKFAGFSGLAFVLLVAACLALAVFVLTFGTMWVRSYPRLPDAGPETTDLGSEPPAIVNLMANRWKVTRSAIPATLIDLAARRVAGIDLVAAGEYVVRVRDGRQTKERLTPYERQVLDLVIERTHGVSCPVEALDIGEAGAAASWVNRFDKAVVKHARDLGLARPRWRGSDLRTIAILLALPLVLFASAFARAHLFEGAGSSDDEWEAGDWFGVAFFAWAGITAWIGAQRDLRDTPAGRTACAAWLGVRNSYRASHSFNNAPAASVAIWERHLAYGVALGAAHEAARDLPFVADDPNEAWSRSTGAWRQIRVNYPERFGYGESPAKVLFGGLWRTVLFGGIAFVVLPIAGGIAWDAGNDALDSQNQQQLGTAFLVTITAIGAVVALYLGIRTFAGLIRLYRAIADFGAPLVIEGDVVKNHLGRVAIDDGHAEEVDAFAGFALTNRLHRGAHVRVTYTKHLGHVKHVDILQDVDAPAAEEGVAPPITTVPFTPIALSADLQAIVSRAVGVEMRPSDITPEAGIPAGLGVAAQVFSDGAGGTVAVAGVERSSGIAGGAAGFVLEMLAKRGQAVAGGASGSATWVREMDLMIRRGNATTVIHVDLPAARGEERLRIAREIAASLSPPNGDTVPGADQETAAPA